MKNVMFKLVGPDSVRKVASEDGITRFRLLSTPFGGPQKKDVHGEFFDAKTDFGDQFGVNMKYLMYDHHLNFLLNDTATPNDLMIVGTAKFAGADEQGRWYDVELDRSHKYHDMIVKLQEQGLLGTSSQCFIGSKIADSETGYISRWIESEISLTPTPAGPETLGKVFAVAKSVGLELTDLEARIKAAGQTVPAAGSAEAANSDAETVDVEAEMDKLLGKTTPTPVPAAQPPAQPALGANGEVDMKALAGQVAEIYALVPTMKAWAEVLLRIDGVLAPPEGESDNGMNLPSVLRMIESAVSNIKTAQVKQNKAQVKFAEYVVTELNAQVTKTVQAQTRKSKLELDLDLEDKDDDPNRKITPVGGAKPKVFRSSIPDHAPGG